MKSLNRSTPLVRISMSKGGQLPVYMFDAMVSSSIESGSINPFSALVTIRRIEFVTSSREVYGKQMLRTALVLFRVSFSAFSATSMTSGGSNDRLPMTLIRSPYWSARSPFSHTWISLSLTIFINASTSYAGLLKFSMENANTVTACTPSS
ncbi:hypothetical protein AWJ20_396 [Sugiyamaella lignohabitans]|uniref:Uncharacterized protein n=1 Tax=Sugiyamaella lignohabitans TaxID=796027 RepID=A0A161HKF7_9ASCO|nr:uncharacterized protein AWJ20_396 [Sugiyamaella lignohabitans]ANB12158.1 hypothetical protein AWJ20_396 [Sugiyamaella lignohabitans]